MREARFDFNPCAFHEYVYLCGRGTKSIEAFCPDTEAFLQLHAELPEGDSPCLVVQENCQLLVLSREYASRWAAEQDHKLAKVSQIRHIYTIVHCITPPAVDSVNNVMYVCQRGQCFCTNLNGYPSIKLD